MAKRSRRASGATGQVGLRFGLPNYLVLLLAAVVIAVGYVLLDHGSITAAPILLVIGYAVLVPAGLLLGFRDTGE